MMTQTTLIGHMLGFSEMEAKTIPTMKKVKERVRYILEEHPSARGNDMILLWRYYREFESDKIKLSFRKFKDLMRATSMETIRRTRQKIQEGGELLPTDKTVLKRRRREEIIRSEIKEV
jgi:hypothetical protein